MVPVGAPASGGTLSCTRHYSVSGSTIASRTPPDSPGSPTTTTAPPKSPSTPPHSPPPPAEACPSAKHAALQKAEDEFCEWKILCDWNSDYYEAYARSRICGAHTASCAPAEGEVIIADGTAYRKLDRPAPIEEGGGWDSPIGRVLPAALRVGYNARQNVVAYLGEKNSKDIYVGLSEQFAKRQSQHGDRFTIRPIAGSVTVARGEARAIEQANEAPSP